MKEAKVQELNPYSCPKWTEAVTQLSAPNGAWILAKPAPHRGKYMESREKILPNPHLTSGAPYKASKTRVSIILGPKQAVDTSTSQPNSYSVTVPAQAMSERSK